MNNLGLLTLGLAALCLTHKEFFGYTHHLIGAVPIKDDDIIDVRTVTYIFVLLERRTYKALCPVDVEFLIGFHHLGSRDGVEVLDFRQARMCLTILLLDETEPLACHLHHIGQFLVYLLHLRFHAGNVLLSLILVELQDTGHLDFHQPQDIITCHLSDQFGIPGLQSAAYPFHSGIHILGILKLTVLIDTLLYENLFQRGEE